MENKQESFYFSLAGVIISCNLLPSPKLFIKFLPAMKKQPQKPKLVSKMSAKEARDFFLESQRFCRIPLPSYFNFGLLIKKVADTLGDKEWENIAESNSSKINGANHVLLTNKNGRYTWRQMEIIHPVLYAHLVREMTKEENWKTIVNRFSDFRKIRNLSCLSIPKKYFSGKSSDAENISHWWENVEQRSIELALQYEWMVKTDIVNCYQSIYTHSIAWAIYGKEKAKENRERHDLIGNVIDKSIRGMRNGQTNGIPPGSVLLDFIAELVLGYADIELSSRIKNRKIKGYKILRYIDDYRIFVKKEEDGAAILKLLSETLFDLGLSLSSAKTKFSQEIIRDSIKPDKLVWDREINPDKNLQKMLLIIHGHAKDFPNSGSITKQLNVVFKKMLKEKKKKPYLRPKTLISIIVDIALHNPKAYPVCFALLGRILKHQITREKEKTKIVSEIWRKFSLMPNIGHMEIWLQRFTLPEGIKSKKGSASYVEGLCKIAEAVKHQKRIEPVLWKNDWIKDKALKKAIDEKKIIVKQKIGKVNGDIPYKEIAPFSDNQY